MGKEEHEKPDQDELDAEGEENRGTKDRRRFFIESGGLGKMAGGRFGKGFWLFDGEGGRVERLRSMRFLDELLGSVAPIAPHFRLFLPEIGRAKGAHDHIEVDFPLAVVAEFLPFFQLSGRFVHTNYISYFLNFTRQGKMEPKRISWQRKKISTSR
jgi:hypothetical protein